MLRLLGKTDANKPLEVVDMGERLGALHLREHFPVVLWPPTAATRKLATRFKALRKGDGKLSPFICRELKE